MIKKICFFVYVEEREHRLHLGIAHFESVLLSFCLSLFFSMSLYPFFSFWFDESMVSYQYIYVKFSRHCLD